MFKRKNRLAKTADIEKVIKSGRVFFNPILSLKFSSRPGHPSRFTVVVGTKVYKDAVKRNRLKRVIREHLKFKNTDLPPGDYMLFVKPKAAGVGENDLIKELKNLLIF